MTYYLKKLGHQELGSIKEPGGKPSRGRYIYISKDDRVLSIFPPLAKYVKNDSSLLPIIPLYSKNVEKVYCNYIYHNDKYNGSTSKRPRNEFRIYSNNSLEMNQRLFETNDIIVMRKGEIVEEEKQTVYFLDRVTPAEVDYYQKCEKIIDSCDIRDSAAIYEGTIDEIERKINSLHTAPIQVVVDSSVPRKIQNSDTQLSDLFTSTSFRDFTMVAYNGRCAVTGSIIRYGNFLNLEAAHIKPKSHGGLYLPNNGLALSRDIHWAFDKGFFTLNEDYTLLVHPKIESDFLKGYNGKQIFIPTEDFFKPSLDNIHYHRNRVFGLFMTSGRL
ncbi:MULTISPECIES: HNH endonuclease [unclassified Bacillus (in: firmicutes)]|uniref:HNH endonuclease n=1 Tax=unclassified Bacillus (in: firmicutes) TaxID=185979 RepID=UPI0008EF966D|nr:MULTISPECIES: HNH endonuclease [unclassified Bacillus (in: firmicutes)]SFJ99586.1 HNH endonuclease [Bacillus sp. 71mf]SFT20460.1 HNH endonuclease [Bacillus sp. 103mf]